MKRTLFCLLRLYCLYLFFVLLHHAARGFQAGLEAGRQQHQQHRTEAGR